MEMKKKRTSRHLWIGRMASAYAAGSASNRTISVETATTTTEFVNAVSSAKGPEVGPWVGVCAAASCSVLKLVNAVQATGKIQSSPTIHARTPSPATIER